MQKKLIILVLVILLIITGSGSAIYFSQKAVKPIEEKPVTVPRKAVKPKILDTDRDGVPDNEDDYPEDPSWSAKLEVLHSNWYRHFFSERYPQGQRVTAVWKFKNPKSVDVYNRIEGFVTLKDAEGVRVGWTSMVYRGTVLKPGEEGFSCQEEEVLDKEVASIEVEVKGQLKETAWRISLKPNVEIMSHSGTYESATKQYVVSGRVKNNENRSVDVYVWVGFYNNSGVLLDVQFDGIWRLAGGELAEFNVKSKTPDANKISTYKISIASQKPY